MQIVDDVVVVLLVSSSLALLTLRIRELDTKSLQKHCVKSVRIQSFSGPHFAAFSPYSVRMRENTDQKNSKKATFHVVKRKNTLRKLYHSTTYHSWLTFNKIASKPSCSQWCSQEPTISARRGWNYKKYRKLSVSVIQTHQLTSTWWWLINFVTTWSCTHSLYQAYLIDG